MANDLHMIKNYANLPKLFFAITTLNMRQFNHSYVIVITNNVCINLVKHITLHLNCAGMLPEKTNNMKL